MTVPGAGVIKHLVETFIADQVGALLGGLVDQVDGAVSWLVGKVDRLITSGVNPEVGHTWFRQRYGVMIVIGAMAFGAVVSVAAIQAVVRQDPGLLLRAVLVQLPLAIVLTMTALGLVQLALTVVNDLTLVVLSAPGITGGTHPVLTWTPVMHQPGVPAFLGLILDVLALGGGLLLWIELVVRAAAVELATLFLPLALVGLAWPGASRWARRLTEVLAALILSKFVIAATLALGSAALNSGHAGSALTGGVLLVMAAVTPFAVLRLVPLVEMGAIAHLEGMGRRAATKLPQTGWSLASRLQQQGVGPEADPPVPPAGTAPVGSRGADHFQPIDGLTLPSGAFGEEEADDAA